MQKSPTEEKKEEVCDKFDAVSTISETDVQSAHTGRRSQGRLSWCTAYCAMPMSLVALRPYFVYLRISRPYNRTPRWRAHGLRRGVAVVGDELKGTGSSSCVAVVGVVMFWLVMSRCCC